jgi:hypothetical protein
MALAPAAGTWPRLPAPVAPWLSWHPGRKEVVCRGPCTCTCPSG